jgi:hypothetical protein
MRELRDVASHAAFDGVDGAPQILADPRVAGEWVARKTVAGLLRRQRLAEISPRTFGSLTTVADRCRQLATAGQPRRSPPTPDSC